MVHVNHKWIFINLLHFSRAKKCSFWPFWRCKKWLSEPQKCYKFVFLSIYGLRKPKFFLFSKNILFKLSPELFISSGTQNSYKYAILKSSRTNLDKIWPFLAFFAHFWHFWPFLAKLAKNICIYDTKKALMNINHYMWVILYGLMKSHVALMDPTHTPTPP